MNDGFSMNMHALYLPPVRGAASEHSEQHVPAL